MMLSLAPNPRQAGHKRWGTGNGISVCTHIASSELMYLDDGGICYTSRIIYSSALPESPSLGYAHPFHYWLASSGKRARTPSPPPKEPSVAGNGEGVSVEPLIPPQSHNLVTAQGHVRTADMPNTRYSQAGIIYKVEAMLQTQQ